MTTLREEVEFLRTYLYIEEARFGDRLRVSIEVAPEAAGQPVPSLILQPLVENAMKHGLGPKPGPGNLWISAAMEADHVCVKIEDDGMGPPAAPPAETDECHGLRNVAGGCARCMAAGVGAIDGARGRRRVRHGAHSEGGDCGMRSLIVDDEEPARARLARHAGGASRISWWRARRGMGWKRSGADRGAAA